MAALDAGLAGASLQLTAVGSGGVPGAPRVASDGEALLFPAVVFAALCRMRHNQQSGEAFEGLVGPLRECSIRWSTSHALNET